MTDGPPTAEVDPSTPHPARRYNYWLGGKDNFASDRASADAIEAVFPHIRTAALENRRFLHRAVRHLVEEAGIRQFLDIGTGLPTADNTHEVAQRIDPGARVVYVDNDPLVLTHARALLTSDPAGATAYLDADLRKPQDIIGHPELAGVLDLSRPVALLLVAVLHFIEGEEAYDIVRTLTGALAPGSYVVISHATGDLIPAATTRKLTGTHTGRGDITGRTHAQVARFFDGLAPVPPGLVVVSRWRAEPGTTAPPDEHVSVYGAVARKPGPA